MRAAGYSRGTIDSFGVHLDDSAADYLSHAENGVLTLIEEAGTESRIIKKGSNQQLSRSEVVGEVPLISPDGQWLAYLRSTRGRSVVWIRPLVGETYADVRITPSNLNVEEMTFTPGDSLVFAALNERHESALYTADRTGQVEPLGIADARYPAASADGKWLAYSQLNHGVWNLRVRDLRTGTTQELTTADCNFISSSWEPDSKTLLYASDCGRALWFTALYRQKVVP
jgi:Tol biopolymer transport system component